MPKIEGFRVRNYRTLKDVALGRFWNQQKTAPLTPLTAVIGKNGVGKSTLFDSFGFLADCLKNGVEEACDSRNRGGFDKIRSQGSTDPIKFEIYYKEDGNARPITYLLSIDQDKAGRPYVLAEALWQYSQGQKSVKILSFLFFNEGRGLVWKGDEAKGDMNSQDLIHAINDLEVRAELIESEKLEFVELEDHRRLGIATFGYLKQHPRISALRRFIEGWYVSYFTPDASRSLPLAGPQKHLNIHGDNLGNVVQFMEREHPKRFQSILNNIANKIPGIHNIDTEKTSDGRLLLRFNDKGFNDPFYAQHMSDGTLKVFAYLLLLEDPSPPPFLCIEEPENGLYHKLLENLAEGFRAHATGRKGSSQIFITTHQPYFVNALNPNEVWILEKGSDGFSSIRRASDNELVRNMVAEGLPLGGLWYSEYLDAE